MPLLFLRNRVSSSSVIGNGPVVTLTSFGTRARSAYLAVESIGRGTLKPNELILWLSEEDARLASRALKRLVRRGLTIASTVDYGPHTKYYPLVARGRTKPGPFVTADDDVIYPREWLRELAKAHLDEPLLIHAHRARHMAINRGRVLSYKHWNLCSCGRASVRHVGTGVSGVIYPDTMARALKTAGTAFETVAPTADDLWLHHIALRHGISTRQIRKKPRDFYRLSSVQRHGGLWRVNVIGNGNDTQLQALYPETAALHSGTQDPNERL